MHSSKHIFHKRLQGTSPTSGNFSFLQMQVAQWQKLTSLIQPILPPQGDWQVVCYQHGTLSISGTNQALISKVRYLSSQYIQNLQTIPVLADLNKLQIILQPTQVIDKKYTRNKLLSNSTQQQLQQAASLVKDAKLSQALLRLASNTNNEHD